MVKTSTTRPCELRRNHGIPELNSVPCDLVPLSAVSACDPNALRYGA